MKLINKLWIAAVLIMVIALAITGCPDDNPKTANPVYSISLSQATLHTFTAATADYEAQTPLSVTVSNTGNQATGSLTIALSGANSGDFTLSKTSLDSIAVSGNDTFTVVPKTELAANTYTATVTVSGGNSISANFGVSFTVNSPGVEYWSITWHLNGGEWAEDGPSDQIEKGETLAKPTDPAKNNCTFVDWYTDAALTQLYTFGAVTGNLNLYAKWQQITPMFYWGNYIPAPVNHAASQWAQETFNLQELIDNREIARRCTGNGIVLMPGDEVPAGPPVVWTEIKGTEVAVKENKSITWNNQVGYYFIITPEEFGDIVIEQLGTPLYPGVTWTRYSEIVDGQPIYIYVFNITTNPYNATHDIKY
ncbi:MAG: InlB B-repeat-containing protein [Treponema sp.]|jgi:uncharacterized repeat protein (TIGR02543 family)|nr:InlB B-repeat-containing protein [Treponema sp.]